MVDIDAYHFIKKTQFSDRSFGFLSVHKHYVIINVEKVEEENRRLMLENLHRSDE